jgi:hypothetical protein
MRRLPLLLLVPLLMTVIPACGQRCPDGPGVSNTLAAVDRWVRVIGMGSTPEALGTSPVEMEVAPLSKSEPAQRPETLWIHSDFTGAVRDALGERGDVYLALSRSEEGREEVSYVIVRTSDGTHHLPGVGCDEGFLRTRLGDRYDAMMDSIIGMTPAGIRQALAADGIE